MRAVVRAVDTRRALEKVNAGVERGLGVMAENALADCTDFTPYLTGAMRRSGHTIVADGKAQIEWGADADTGRYTRYQYETDSLNHDTIGNAINAPRAQGHWFEGAKEERIESWIAIMRQVISR